MEGGQWRHHVVLGKQPSRAPRGVGAKKLRNAMPVDLLAEILKEAQLKRGERRADVVIDLCAGYRSLEPVVRAAGLVYIAVDLKDAKGGDEDVGA